MFEVKPTYSTQSWQFSPVDLQLIDLALHEDLGEPYQDITSQLLFGNSQKTSIAKIISKHPTPIVVSGLPLITLILKKLFPQAEIATHYQDGESADCGAILATLAAPAAILLMAERTILNFLQRLSAVATLTAQLVTQIQHTSMKILDTRKTTPGLRRLEKYAVFCGGGVNHRMGLYDAIMVKDTHIDLAGGVKQALAKLPLLATHSLPVIIEVRNNAELTAALEYGENKISRILLDNMPLDLLAACVQHCKAQQIQTEASGNIRLHNIQFIAETGVDFASLGCLTHSATTVDLSMKCDR